MSAGRKKDPIWCYFTEKIELGKKGCKAVCKTCNKEMQGIVARMKNHHLSCNKESQVDSAEIDDMPEITTDCEPGICENVEKDLALSGPYGLKRKSSTCVDRCKKLNLKDLSSHIVKTSASQKEQIDRQLARFFYASNISFRSVDNPHFKKLMAMLRPGYTPPNKIDLGNALLNKVYTEELQKCSTTLAGQTVCMSLDGWSNIHNQPIVCICVTTMEGDVHLVDTIDTSAQPHTSANLTTLASAAITSVENKFSCKIRSFVTDNAANMASMRNELSHSFDVITYGCSAHLLNLLAKDLEIPNVSEHVIQIVKYFRNNFARVKFQQKQGIGLQLPSQVRWNTMCDSIESYIKNWPIILQVVEENPNSIDQAIKTKVSNIMIKRNAQDLVQRLKPISVAIDRVQKDNCSIADAVSVWKMLENELKGLDHLNLNKFKKRYEQALTPAHFLAFLLSPKFDPKDLSPWEKEIAIDLVKEKYNDSELLSILLKFTIRAEPFNGTLFNQKAVESLNALQWWKSFALLKDCVTAKDLEVIEALVTCKATSAGVERIFSTFGLVHSKLRNQLGVEKAGKLVFLAKSLNEKTIKFD